MNEVLMFLLLLGVGVAFFGMFYLSIKLFDKI